VWVGVTAQCSWVSGSTLESNILRFLINDVVAEWSVLPSTVITPNLTVPQFAAVLRERLPGGAVMPPGDLDPGDAACTTKVSRGGSSAIQVLGGTVSAMGANAEARWAEMSVVYSPHSGTSDQGVAVLSMTCT